MNALEDFAASQAFAYRDAVFVFVFIFGFTYDIFEAMKACTKTALIAAFIKLAFLVHHNIVVIHDPAHRTISRFA